MLEHIDKLFDLIERSSETAAALDVKQNQYASQLRLLGDLRQMAAELKYMTEELINGQK